MTDAVSMPHWSLPFLSRHWTTMQGWVRFSNNLLIQCNNSHSCEFVSILWSSGTDNQCCWICQVSSCMTHLIGWVSLQRTYWSVSYTLLWYWLNWSIMQVIMIARLHAMYQRSRKVLIFLVVIFLAITIANAVMFALMTMQLSGGKL
jgi:hypothetical protein